MYHELSPQNSKGFRGLKVWMALRQVGREGYVRMISEDIELARIFHELTESHEELEPFLFGLSVSSFRYVPRDLKPVLYQILPPVVRCSSLTIRGVINISSSFLRSVLV